MTPPKLATVTLTRGSAVTALAVVSNLALGCVDVLNPISAEGLLASVNLAALAMLRCWHTSLLAAMAFVLYLVFNMLVNLVAINAAVVAHDPASLMLLAPTSLAAAALFMQGLTPAEHEPRASDDKPAADTASLEARIWR